MHTFPISFHHASNTIDTTSRVTLDTIMFRGSIDIIDLDICKVFAGAGLGVSRTDQKKSVKTPIAQNTSSRNIYNRAAQLFLGISGELSHKTTIELGYLYGDYGKTQKIKDATKDSRIPLRSHNIFFGVRYEL
ncbi:MAG UNVERIFIED_CONTAM: hypothetical protein LVQ98_07085 [Rickettsiaceae bacterium]